MAHPRTLSAAVLPAALFLLTTCGHDVTAPPAPTQLAFLQQPANLVAGHQFSQAVKVRADDAHGNKVASFTGSVTVALANNPGGATLSGSTTVAALDGIPGVELGDLERRDLPSRFDLPRPSRRVSHFPPMRRASAFSPSTRGPLRVQKRPLNELQVSVSSTWEASQCNAR